LRWSFGHGWPNLAWAVEHSFGIDPEAGGRQVDDLLRVVEVNALALRIGISERTCRYRIASARAS
jgi:hypothetical protein